MQVIHDMHTFEWWLHGHRLLLHGDWMYVALMTWCIIVKLCFTIPPPSTESPSMPSTEAPSEPSTATPSITTMPTVAPRPRKVMGVGVTPSAISTSPTLTVTWQALASGALTYTVKYSTQPGEVNTPPEEALEVTGISGTSTILTALEGGTTYYIWVVGVSESGQGPHSDRTSRVTYDSKLDTTGKVWVYRQWLMIGDVLKKSWKSKYGKLGVVTLSTSAIGYVHNIMSLFIAIVNIYYVARQMIAFTYSAYQTPLSHGPLNPDSRSESNPGSTQMCVHTAI